MKKTLIALVSLLVLTVIFRIALYPKLEIISGYNAKILCSCIFVSGLDADEAIRTDLGFGPLWLASRDVNLAEKRVDASVLGMHPKRAWYREGLGCILTGGKETLPSLPKALPLPDAAYHSSALKDSIAPGSDAIQAALSAAFDAEGEQKLNTRAVVVFKNGELIGEAYADYVTKDTPLLGWSMAKSITGLLAGILRSKGYWQLDAPFPLAEWKGDERSLITLRHVLNMTSGLEWEEEYGKVSPATSMLYSQEGMGKYAASFAGRHEPGAHWQYSSGTSNILAYAMRNAFEKQEDYLKFPYEKLFGPLGARSFLLETDVSGHFVGSSYAFATARDWALIGQLCLQQGHWNGEQLVDSSWIDFIRTPVAASGGKYGGHFWLNASGRYAHMGPNDYWLDGFQGQQVSIHPRQAMVIVRLGVMYDESDFDFDGWIGRVIDAASSEIPTATIEGALLNNQTAR